MSKNLLIVLSLALTLSGCQTGHGGITKSSDNNGSFMGLWSTYARCQSSGDIEQLKQDASALTAAANRVHAQETFVLPLPGKIERLVTSPTARLAVDVKAMAAACSLRAGQVAIEARKFDLVRPLLESIFAYHPQSDYQYYSAQAKTMLSSLETEVVKVSLQIH